MFYCCSLFVWILPYFLVDCNTNKNNSSFSSPAIGKGAEFEFASSKCLHSWSFDYCKIIYSLRTKTPYCNNESLLGVDIHLQLKIAYDYYVLASRDDLLIFALIRVHTYYRAPHFSNSSSLTLLPGILAFRKLNVSTFTMQESKFQELSQDCELTFEQYSYVQ